MIPPQTESLSGWRARARRRDGLTLAGLARPSAREPTVRNSRSGWPDQRQSRSEEVVKADALIRFILSGNRSLEEFAIPLAGISLGVFFAISGGNKVFVASQHKLMYDTIVSAGIPFPYIMAYFVSPVEFVCGCLLIIGLLSILCCIAFIIDMIVAITTVKLATIAKGLSVVDWLDDFLYLPEVMYIIIFLLLISSGPGRLSVDHWIAVRSGLLHAE
jgi:putative oxidoreductase